MVANEHVWRPALPQFLKFIMPSAARPASSNASPDFFSILVFAKGIRRVVGVHSVTHAVMPVANVDYCYCRERKRLYYNSTCLDCTGTASVALPRPRPK